MSVEYKLCSWMEVVDQISALAADHHAEVNVFDDVPLNINWSRYFATEMAGNYILVVAKTEVETVSTLVGWVGFFVYDHMRHKDYKIAKEDWYYVIPSYRKMGIAKKMFEFAESELKDAGVKRVMVSCKVEHDHTGLIESMGYTNHEKNFTKVLT